MINLENVSTRKFIMDSKDACDLRIWYARRLLLEHNITDYQKLKDFLESELAKEVTKRNSEFLYGIILLQGELKFVENKITKANEKGKQLEIFTYDSLNSSQIDDKSINITDERNKGKILLCSSPIILGSGIKSIRKLPITQLKHLIGHVDPNNLKNCLSNLDSTTSKKIASIDRAIRFYDEQVIRQYFETPNKECNLFFLNSKEKQELIEEQIKDIAEYIADNAKECIWGTLSDTQKKRMLAASLTTRDGTIARVKDNFERNIKLYTTLTELKNGILNEQEVVTIIGGDVKLERKRPIDRIITKKR